MLAISLSGVPLTDTGRRSPNNNTLSLVLVVVWYSGGALVLIDKADLRWTRLVLGWETVSGFAFVECAGFEFTFIEWQF